MAASEIFNKIGTDSASWEAKKRAIDLECELLNTLEKDDVKILNDMVDAYLEYADKVSEAAYNMGFRHGAAEQN